MSLDVVTFGCRLNVVESEVIKRAAVGLDDAVVVNTCAVTAEAVRQAKQAIRRIKREQPQRRIVVTGCAAQAGPETSPPCRKSTACSATRKSSMRGRGPAPRASPSVTSWHRGR